MSRQQHNPKLRFYKLAVAQSDIGSALAGFRQIVELKLDSSESLFRTLIFGAIVSYAKPFVGNKMYGKLSKHWEEFPNTSLSRAHFELIELRHKIVAHNDWEDVQVVLIPPGSKLTVEGHPPIEVDEMCFAVKIPGVHESRIEDFIALCEHQDLALLEELGATKDILFQPDDLPRGPFTLEF